MSTKEWQMSTDDSLRHIFQWCCCGENGMLPLLLAYLSRVKSCNVNILIHLSPPPGDWGTGTGTVVLTRRECSTYVHTPLVNFNFIWPTHVTGTWSAFAASSSCHQNCQLRHLYLSLGHLISFDSFNLVPLSGIKLLAIQPANNFMHLCRKFGF